MARIKYNEAAGLAVKRGRPRLHPGGILERTRARAGGGNTPGDSSPFPPIGRPRTSPETRHELPRIALNRPIFWRYEAAGGRTVPAEKGCARKRGKRASL